MYVNNTFFKTVDLLERGMTVSQIRREVIGNNIANAETPNFKRSDINFEAQLGRALASENDKGQLKALATNPRHIPFYQPLNYKDVRPRKVLDYLTDSKNNGNNVDIEQESMDSVRNQMRYELLAEALRFQFNQINMVVR